MEEHLQYALGAQLVPTPTFSGTLFSYEKMLTAFG
jgi:hypothetical protein